MLVVTDHHHIEGLENVVRDNADLEDIIIASGDFSVTQRTPSQSESKLKGYQNRYKLTKFEGLPKRNMLRMPLDFEDKKKAIEEGIMNARKNEFENLLAWYGAGPVYNLARKIYVGYLMDAQGKKIVVFKGSEPVIAHTQEIIYRRLKRDKGLKGNDVMNYIIDFLVDKRPALFAIIRKQLTNYDPCLAEDDNSDSFVGEEKSIIDSLKATLSTQNFNGAVPTSELVYQTRLGIPGEDGFEYLEDVRWDIVDKTILISIPYFKDSAESWTKILGAEDRLKKFIQRNSNIPYCLILSHANPNPAKGMKRGTSMDNNMHPITQLCRAITETKRYKPGNITMITGHLHETWDKYRWRDVPPLQIKPIGAEKVARINTETNNIRYENIKRIKRR